MALQVRNDELADILRPDFQARYEPNFAWKSASSLLQTLPVVRGAWPMSSVDYTVANRGIDISGQGNHLTSNNNVAFRYVTGEDLIPHANFGGVNQYLSRADGGAANWADITGTETYVDANVRGLTTGGWFWADALTILMFVIGKAPNTGAAADAYKLLWRGDLANDPFFFSISSGAALASVTSTVVTTTGGWYFAVGRFDPGNSVDVYVNGTWDTVATAIAAIADQAAAFTIGASSTPGNYFDGRASLCFLCACYLSDSIVGAMFQQTRALFGV